MYSAWMMTYGAYAGPAAAASKPGIRRRTNTDKRQEKKKLQEKLDLINRSAGRRPMPRPAVFKDKSKYDRKRQKRIDRHECMA